MGMSGEDWAELVGLKERCERLMNDFDALPYRVRRLMADHPGGLGVESVLSFYREHGEGATVAAVRNDVERRYAVARMKGRC